MTATDYVFDEFGRICDICGRPRRSDELTTRDGVVICVRHPGYRRAQELDKLNAQRRVPIERPVKNTKPLSPSPTYLTEEAQLFDLVVNVAPYETFDTTSDGAPGVTGTQSFTAAAWAMIYLLGIVSEGRRPAAWRTAALAKAKALGEYLIAHQVLFGAAASMSSVVRGALGNSVTPETYAASDSGIACVAMVRLYRATGVNRYLISAKQCAEFIVSLQATDLLLTSPTALFYGPPAHSLTNNGVAFVPELAFYPGDLACLWGTTELLAAAGDGTYGPTTDLGFWSTAPARLLSDSIAQQRAFWTTGLGVNGFSAGSPHSFFDATALAWVDTSHEEGDNGDFKIGSADWCQGLRALFEVDGVSTQVAALWDYLQTFESNSHFEFAAAAPDKTILATPGGTYDATLCVAASLDTANLVNASRYYDWGAGGNLAGIQSSRAPSSLLAAKVALSEPRHRTAEGSSRDGRTQYLGRIGFSALAFQPYDWDGRRRESVTRAAQAGNFYRYRQAFGGSE